jgi:hypothetical protein
MVLGACFLGLIWYSMVSSASESSAAVAGLAVLGTGVLLAALVVGRFNAHAPAPLRNLATYYRQHWLGCTAWLLWTLFAAFLGRGHAVEHAAQAAELKAVQERQVRAAVEEQRRVQEAARQREEWLRQNAAAAINRATEAIASARAAATAGDFRLATQQVESARKTLEPSAKLKPPVAGVDPLLQQAAQLAAEIAPFVAALQTIDEAARAATATFADALATEDACIQATTKLKTIEGPPAQRFRTEIARTKQDLAKRSRSVHAAADRLRHEQALKLAVEYLCGSSPPLIGGWDGELVGSESYISRTAHDPDSIDVENCTVPKLTDDCWITICDVRGKNAFGALVLNRYKFSVGKNNEIRSARSLD